jgi:hypothetical protein
MIGNEVTTYSELKRRQADAVVAISGADRTSWNHHEFVVDPSETLSGVARWNGAIGYKDQRVNEPLQQMFQYARHYGQDAETLTSYRDALKTMLHENSHLLAQQGGHHRDGEAAYQTKAGKALEEGVTEGWSHRHVNEYIDELGLERIAPGIRDAHSSKAVYPQFVPAAQTFSDAIGRRTGRSGDEVLTRLNRQTVDTKFGTAAALLYDASDLPKLENDRQRQESIRRIADAMRRPFEDLADLPKADRLRRQSALAGAKAEQLGSAEVRAITGERRSGGPQAERQVTERGAAAGRQTGQGPSPQLADTMRIGLGGSPPLGSTRRLDGSRLGSRRGTPATTPQRGPQRGPQRDGR